MSDEENFMFRCIYLVLALASAVLLTWVITGFIVRAVNHFYSQDSIEVAAEEEENTFFMYGFAHHDPDEKIYSYACECAYTESGDDE